MKILNINPNSLIPYENNPRKNDAAVEYVANSIREFGFKVPIIIDKNNVVVTGHTRLKAAETSQDRGKMAKIGSDAYAKVSAEMKAKGYTQAQVDAKSGQISIGAMKNFWKTEAANAGYDYIEVKKARW